MIQKIFTTVTTSLGMLLIPLVTVGAAGPYFGQVDDLFTRFGGFIENVLIPLIFAFALLVFVWGMFRFFVWGQANEEDRSKGRQLIIWSIVGLVFMVSIWGIVAIVAEGVFGTTTGSNLPTLPGTPTLAP